MTINQVVWQVILILASALCVGSGTCGLVWMVNIGTELISGRADPFWLLLVVFFTGLGVIPCVKLVRLARREIREDKAGRDH